ncbi:hypothetical protein GGF42_008078 [Coemansia sp. RSA 2424]|nr:hypothetical protein GGF42_008078 [Coemansia sp. RSA 2424]
MKLVQLLVRSPSVATADDFSVDIGVEQSISELKQKIEGSHQASPLAREMRIIWKGRELRDTDTVRSIYVDEEASEAQTVHFVLSSPALTGRPGRSEAKGSVEERVVEERAAEESVAEESVAGPSVVPLGNQFQYVLVDGTPYLMVLRPQQEQAGGVGSETGDVQALQRLNAHLEQRNRMLQELEETSSRLSRLMALNRARDGRGGARDAAAGGGGGAELGHPLGDVLRNVNFGAIWSVGWMLLRMLLLVVVFAHDASLGRVLALAVAVACFFALRSAWVQQCLAWLAQHNSHAAADRRRRQFSVWEKTRALVVALLTSLVPSEPLQAPDE